MNISERIRGILNEVRGGKPSTITVYHGTHNNKENLISREGLQASSTMGYNSASWYMVSTDLSSALFHATPDGESDAIVFEFEIPVTNEKWEGYPYFWPPYDRSGDSKWFALKQAIPAKFIKEIHRIPYDDFIGQKNAGLNSLNEEVIEETQTGQKDLEKLTNDVLKLIAEAILKEKAHMIFLTDNDSEPLTSMPLVNTLMLNEEGFSEIGDFVNATNIRIAPTSIPIRGKKSIKGELEYGGPNNYNEEYYKIWLKYEDSDLKEINDVFDRDGREVTTNDIYFKLFYIFYSTLLHELQHAYDAFRSKGKAFSGQLTKDYTSTQQKANMLMQTKSGYDDLTPEEVAAINKSRTDYLNLVHEINARYAQAMQKTILTSMDFDTFDDIKKDWKEVYRDFKTNFDGWRHLSDKMKKKLTRRVAKAYQEAIENLKTASEKYSKEDLKMVTEISNIRKIVRQVLRESIHEEREVEGISDKTKLSIFDFDSTLVNTPLPEDGIPEWEAQSGMPWEGRWWDNPESLNTDVFDIPTNPQVISAYEKEKSNSNNLVVMMTGRVKRLSKGVEKILSMHGLKFDDYLYNSGNETSSDKVNKMELALRYNPNIREIEMWDDRSEHIPVFQKWGDAMMQQGYLDNFKINHVK